MARPSPTPKKPPQPATEVGYPLMEKLIETEQFEKVNKSFAGCYGILERMLKNKAGGLKKQKEVRSAIQAYDLTVQLVKELLKFKQQLAKTEAPQGAPQSGVKK